MQWVHRLTTGGTGTGARAGADERPPSSRSLAKRVQQAHEMAADAARSARDARAEVEALWRRMPTALPPATMRGKVLLMQKLLGMRQEWQPHLRDDPHWLSLVRVVTELRDQLAAAAAAGSPAALLAAIGIDPTAEETAPMTTRRHPAVGHQVRVLTGTYAGEMGEVVHVQLTGDPLHVCGYYVQLSGIHIAILPPEQVAFRSTVPLREEQRLSPPAPPAPPAMMAAPFGFVRDRDHAAEQH